MLIHKYNINHSNLNPNNILFDENFYPHLSDFYKAKINGKSNFDDFYDASEVKNTIFNKKTDVYSFGMIMQKLLTTFRRRNSKLIDYVNQGFIDLIKKCKSKNQEERPNFEDIFTMLSYDENCYIKSVHINEISNYVKRIANDLIFCTICKNKILNGDLLYYPGFSYHKSCIKCTVCNKKFDSESKIEDFVCIAPGLFLCQQYCIDHLSSQKLPQCQDKINQNIVREIFDYPVFNNDNTANYKPEEILVDSDMIENSFRIDKPYESFIPTVTFHFDVSPEEIDFKK